MPEIMHKVQPIEECFKGYKSDLKVYNIGFIGVFDSTRRNVIARNAKEAKEIFAECEGVTASKRIIARHHDSASLNDDRPKYRRG